MKSLMLVVKITHKCNLKCLYCYDSDANIKNNSIMDFDTIKKLIEWSNTFCKLNEITDITYVWHGGEPLLAGIYIFDNIVRLQKEILSSLNYHNGIQTNGILINNGIASFLKMNNFMVSVSLDGTIMDYRN